MYFNDGGYSDTQYSAYKLRKKARELSMVLPRLMDSIGADCIAVTGKSGMALAFATLMLIDFPLIVVRKRGENSHGNPVEGTDGIDLRRYLILDDFVSSGNTVRSIVELIEERQAMRRNGADMECAGVLEYLRYGDEGCDVGHRVGRRVGVGDGYSVKVYNLPR